MSTRSIQLIEIGDWREADIRAEWSERSSWKTPDARLQKQIDDAWENALIAPFGGHLFDGPMCRLESHAVEGGSLRLRLSPTTYRTFLGTNMQRPMPAELDDASPLANSLGLSAALLSSDGWLVFGRRNTRVAYYPERIHPFAGSLEPPADAQMTINVFDDIRRELKEELGLSPNDLTSLRCIGLVHDARLRQPELIFETHTSRTRAEIDAAFDKIEHGSTWAVPTSEQGLTAALDEPLLTPVAIATILLVGRIIVGSDWFERRSAGRVIGGM